MCLRPSMQRPADTVVQAAIVAIMVMVTLCAVLLESGVMP